MKAKIAFLCVTILLLTSCDYNERYFEGLNDKNVTDIKTIDYTMSEDDYAAVANNTTNKQIADNAGTRAALNAIRSQHAFSVEATAATYAPAFLAAKWPTADNGSVVRLTYNMQENLPDYVRQVSAGKIYVVSKANYDSIWGADKGITFFTPLKKAATHIPNILADSFPNAQNGDVVLVNYNEAQQEPTNTITALNEDFEQFTSTVNHAQITGWYNYARIGTYAWQGRNYNNNGYVQNSAYRHKAGKLESYLITPPINVTTNMTFTFDMAYGNYRTAGGRLSVLISKNFTPATDSATMSNNIATATWDNVTDSFSMNVPAAGQTYATLSTAGKISLAAYAGSTIHIAFRYDGDTLGGKTTTTQLDNVVVKEESHETTTLPIATPVNALYTFNGSTWKRYTEHNIYVLQKSDFAAMGSRYDNFNASMKADNYLPAFLQQKYPYAQADQTVMVVYKYYNNGTTYLTADEYIYTNGVWTKNNALVVRTDQFIKANEAWIYNPSVVINLSPIRNDATISRYYQTATDWVWENIDMAQLGCTSKGQGYVTSYGNNEYYTGCSAYYNNVDMRPNKAREQYAAGYDGLSDDEVVARMQQHLIEVMPHVLAKLHPDAAPVDGVEVTYTVNVPIFTGVNIHECTHTMVFKVIGVGQFEYVPDSFKEITKK